MSKVVAVIGGGLSGLSAAHTILQSGGNVVLLERNAFMGGNSTKATSGINGAGTRTQKAMGVPDTKEIFEEDTIRGATGIKTGPCPPTYANGRVLTHNSASAVHWIQDSFGLGLDTVSRLGGHSHPRTHRTKAGTTFPGMEITYALMKKYEELSEANPDRVKLINRAKVHKLETGANGQITGVTYQGKNGEDITVACDAAVVSTGGYGAGGLFEKSTLIENRPELGHLPTTNGEHCDGSGITFSQAIGGNGVDLSHIQVHPTGLVHLDDPHNRVKFLAAEALRGEGGIILDRDGNRFCNDIGTRDYVSMQMWKHNKAPYRLILNSKASSGIAWHCKHYCGRRVMKQCHGNELASDIGVSTQQLQKSFDSYNSYAIKKNDPWGKKYFDGTPYHVDDTFQVAVVTPVVHYTMGGIQVDEDAQVIYKKNSKAVPGLFAAGEVTGGVHGKNRLGGSALLECVVYGRVAGSSASRYIWNGPPTKNVHNQPGPEAKDDTLGGPPTNSPPNTDAFNYPSTGKPGPAIKKIQQNAVVAAATQVTKGGEYTLEQIATHNKETDVWVTVDGKVLDVTTFLPDHPGGKMAIMAFAGRDATEEFNMVHDEGVIEKYAPETIIGKLKGFQAKL